MLTPMHAFIGTFTRTPPDPGGKATGIAVMRLDARSGALTPVETVAGVDNPSFVALHPTAPILYAVNAVPDGAVSAFAVDEHSGGLTFLGRQPTDGADPCHVVADATGRWVLAANYGGGSVVVFPVEGGGRLGPHTALVQHEGAGIDPRRQAGPHPHSVNLDPRNRFALVPDLGLDRVFAYRFDPARGRLAANDPPWVQSAPGSGPRHVSFHPNGRWVYVVGELDSTLGAYDYDDDRGALREIQTVSTLPQDFDGTSTAADVHVDPSGRFIYASNRGHDSVAAFAIDAGTGRVAPVGHEPTRGRTPRNFAFDPTGTFVLVANQDSDTIVTFRVEEDGRLAPTGEVAETPTPVCIRFAAK